MNFYFYLNYANVKNSLDWDMFLGTVPTSGQLCWSSRDVIKWLFSAIMKSTESEKSSEAAREKDEHIR